MIGSGVISAIYASCLRNMPFSASFCARGDYIELDNAGNGRRAGACAEATSTTASDRLSAALKRESVGAERANRREG
jgi:hypothetical protein